MREFLPNYSGLSNCEGPRVIADLTLVKRTFSACRTALREEPQDRTTIRNVVVTNCTQTGCSFSTTVFEDILVNGLRTSGRHPLFLWGCVFKHVKLSGQIGSLKLNRVIDTNFDRAPKRQAKWDAFFREYYREVDWALDIREAEFTGGVDFTCLPGSLVRYDAATQACVERRALADIDWNDPALKGTGLGVGLRWFLEDRIYDSTVVVASRRAKHFKKELEGIERLRRIGVAKPD